MLQHARLISEIASPKHSQSTLAKNMLTPPRRHARSAHMDYGRLKRTLTLRLNFQYQSCWEYNVPAETELVSCMGGISAGASAVADSPVILEPGTVKFKFILNDDGAEFSMQTWRT